MTYLNETCHPVIHVILLQPGTVKPLIVKFSHCLARIFVIEDVYPEKLGSKEILAIALSPDGEFGKVKMA